MKLPAVSREAVLRIMRMAAVNGCQCPAHSQSFSGISAQNCASKTQQQNSKEYAVEMACSNIRYGKGVTAEVGMDLQNMNAKHVALFTDKNLVNLPPVLETIKSLEQNNINFSLFDNVRIEPTDVSFQEGIDFAKNGNFDAFLAVGGGSVIDSAKAANLLLCHPNHELLDFVNAPIGKGLPTENELKPLLAVPTTAGTGSETTGVAVFDYTPLKAKTGIGNRALRPLLGIVDPLHTLHMPARVTANSGFDVFCHALESYTAIPYTERSPRPSNPKLRPAYQGSNPISDVWSKHALKVCVDYLKRAVSDPHDMEARSEMHLASVFAGIGFGNAGVHLCHGMSYALSGMVKKYQAEDYNVEHALVPHGLSVIITAPAVFNYTAPACPERHLDAAEILGVDISNAKKEDAGPILSDAIRKFMYDLNVDDGISSFGYTSLDIPDLVNGTLPQHRVTKLAPAGEPAPEEFSMIYEQSLKIY
ncbi:hydroxyacid-oxoacid transhydrogenase, mitochondrial-like [Hydractinia symbiolongicarpus]|uniref:hydroxyacid-oxoacid transhydrogenase, mitochondrial-like n=1 Tax=Hydractinia symbiolongicarpus TaxID=13093 RepID=UPI00254C89EA|nr:hydroxyacid-oxoacid transhydrogenase, mitochondrial-like [Hydractinia symbiolongicarpus]